MNYEEYRQRKKEKFESLDNDPQRVKCFTCYRPKKNCLCDYIEPFKTKARFVLLMHIKEAKKERLGTGRISSATLSNSEVIVGVDFTKDNRVNELLNDPKYYPMVLYPGEDAYNVSEQPLSEFNYPEGKELLIFVIDGTWPCAKKMMKESLNIRNLPRICFTPKGKSNFIIKHQPDESCFSTLESIHFMLGEMMKVGLEDSDIYRDNLLKVFKAHVDFQFFCQTDPSVPSNRGKKRDRSNTEMKVVPKKNRKFVID